MSEADNLAVPTVHLNGTSKATLLEQQASIRDAIRNTIDVLRKAAPHSRDYYPQEGDAWKRAEQQHLARIKLLNDMYGEMMQISLLTDAQNK